MVNYNIVQKNKETFTTLRDGNGNVKYNIVNRAEPRTIVLNGDKTKYRIVIKN